jgi:hypothetical protein
MANAGYQLQYTVVYPATYDNARNRYTTITGTAYY